MKRGGPRPPTQLPSVDWSLPYSLRYRSASDIILAVRTDLTVERRI